MLCIRRRKGERIVIQCGSEIIDLVVQEIDSMNQVQLAFKAAKSVIIDREEVYLAKVNKSEPSA